MASCSIQKHTTSPATSEGEIMSEPLPDGGFFPMVYEELRRLAAAKLAHEPAGHTLDATALVHEAYLRLGDAASPDRSGFLRSAALAMQHILVDHARRKRTAKRGGYARRFTVMEGDRVTVADPDTLLDIAAALDRLSAEDPSSAEVARFRLFGGLSIDEAAVALGISRAARFANGRTLDPGSRPLSRRKLTPILEPANRNADRRLEQVRLGIFGYFDLLILGLGKRGARNGRFHREE